LAHSLKKQKAKNFTAQAKIPPTRKKSNKYQKIFHSRTNKSKREKKMAPKSFR
jgi:hypothetical protein